MRAIQTKKHLYLWNPWSDGVNKFKTATNGTSSYRAMQKIAKDDSQITPRLELFDHRIPEELYDIENDPDCLHNLIEKESKLAVVSELRNDLEKIMRETNDHALDAFLNRADPKSGPEYTAKKQDESTARRKGKRGKRTKKKAR
ncbi:MAG: N-sulfoglucosamine sulfohydrolase [Pseudoalteromonas tetraodonis]|jgi:N-sulfoglucosamine sulfohydrolase